MCTNFDVKFEVKSPRRCRMFCMFPERIHIYFTTIKMHITEVVGSSYKTSKPLYKNTRNVNVLNRAY